MVETNGFDRDAEKNYRILMEENPDLVKAARRQSVAIDPETGLPRAEKDGMRTASLVPNGEERRPSLVTHEQESRRASLVPRTKN